MKKPFCSCLILIAVLILITLTACGGGGDTQNGTGSVTGQQPQNDPGGSGDLNAFQEQVLSIINGVRAEGRNCGTAQFPPAGDVVWDDRIEASALDHSLDMAAMGVLTHEGSDGSDAGDRLLANGYDAFSWGENLLAGLDDVEAAIEALLDSPSHCEIIMDASYQEAGMQSAVGPFMGVTTTYWTLVLATEK